MDRLKLLENLIMMAAADGTVSTSEIEMLAERCSAWGISDEEFTGALHSATQAASEWQIPADRDARVHMLQELIRMMAADGQLLENEKKLFAVMAATMKISAAELNQIIDGVVPE